ncbi:hypothetical protein OUZ56_030927 [Daphnia magna]|uniref:Uncharacterized protein n=1 Tax=Daphnia magna TaxID=35525 RepID=A0ABQ9ZSR5_9CRUS|nr:hypothetical protein OUZ56_030927 [Daphnia magna]
MVPSDEFCRFQHRFPREPLSYITTDCSELLLRTNNDCEGLHNDWNKLAGGPNLPFYKMTLVLEQLCEDVKLSQKLLSHEKIKAHRKKETQLKNSILFALWTRYQDNELSTVELLEEIVLELRTSFPTVVTDHPLNLNDENIDNYDMSFVSDDEM